jgi:hypothetical protein
MKSLKYLIAMAVLVLAITPSLAFGQHNTGTQGCCDLLDPYWTLIASPVGAGPVYSVDPAAGWIAASPGSAWINPTGSLVDMPFGLYDYSVALPSNWAGGIISGEFAADNSACILGYGPGACTTGGDHGFTHYSPFSIFVPAATPDLVFEVTNGPTFALVTGLEVEFNPTTTPEPSSLLLMGTGVLGLIGVVRRKLVR